MKTLPVHILDLEGTTLQLDFRVTTLEENSGDGGNSSISELEVRVESLENTSTDHETRLSAAEANIEGNGMHLWIYFDIFQKNVINFSRSTEYVLKFLSLCYTFQMWKL